MSRNEKIDQLVETFFSGRLTRRNFLKQAAALGLSTAGALAIVESVFNNTRAAYAAQVDRSKLSKELNVYNWSDYIDEATIPAFEKEFGVKVNYDTFEDNESMLAKVQSGATGYDVVYPTGYMVEIMMKEKLLAPLNHDNIPNISGVNRALRNPPYDPGMKYSIPYQWGTTGFGYNSEKVKGNVNSWSVLFDPQYKGKITILDDMRGALCVALKYMGYSLNTTDKNELMEAKQLLMEQKPLLKAYMSAPVKSLLISNEVWISELWSGDVYMAMEENEALVYCIPKEGCEVWTDNMCILKSAPHKYTAEVWINYNMRPEVSAAVSNYVWYATPLDTAKPLINEEALNDPGIYPPQEVLDRCEFLVDIGEATRIYDRIWTELKAM